MRDESKLINSKKNTKRSKAKRSSIVGLFLISCVLIGFLADGMLAVSKTISELNKTYTDDCKIEINAFMESDPTRCREYADKFQAVMELYNMPYNLTGDGWDYYIHSDVVFDYDTAEWAEVVNESTYLDTCNFLNTSHPLNKINYYSELAHSSFLSGYISIGEAFRYALAQREKNQTLINRSEQHLLHIVRAYDLWTNISGDGRMVRYLVPDTPKGRKYIYNSIFTESWAGSHNIYSKNYTYSGKEYKFYIYGGTSVDCYHSVYGALGCIYLLCNNTQIRTIIRRTVDRMLTYHENNSWKFLDADGKTHNMGAEAIQGSPISDTMYTLLFLRVGKTVNPRKWGGKYDRYVFDRLFNKDCGKHIILGIQSIFIWSGGYFNVNLPVSIAGILTFLEDDHTLKQYYRNRFLRACHELTKYHRYAWYDIIYYLGNAEIDYSNYEMVISAPNEIRINSYWQDYIDANIGDTLMRLSYRKFPYRDWRHASGNASYSDPNYTPIPSAGYPEQNRYYWYEDPDIPSNNWLVTIVARDASIISIRNYMDVAMPIDWLNTDSWIYGRNPFVRSQSAGDGRRGCLGGVYTVPYWIARYLSLPAVATS